MVLANLTKTVFAASVFLVAGPALATPVPSDITTSSYQAPLTTNQSLSAVGITGPGSTTIIPHSHYTSFSGDYNVYGIGTKASFSGIDIPIVTHAGGWLLVTVDDYTKGSSGLASLQGSIDGKAITFTDVLTAAGKPTANYVGTALVAVGNAVTTNNLIFSGVGGSALSEKSGPGFFGGGFTFVATTPEPAAWIMMITGLAFVGGMLRRQRNLLTA